VKKILQRIAWWKKRLTKMSAEMIKHRDSESRAQMRVWALAMAGFIHSAAKRDLVAVPEASFVQEILGDWENAELATRLAIVRFVLQTLDRVLDGNTEIGTQILGDFAIHMCSFPQVISLVARPDDRPPATRKHTPARGTSRAEATHGTRSKKARLLPRKVSRLR
jgi:hypothetical protein